MGVSPPDGPVDAPPAAAASPGARTPGASAGVWVEIAASTGGASSGGVSSAGAVAGA
jgi:hypothetical protein